MMPNGMLAREKCEDAGIGNQLDGGAIVYVSAAIGVSLHSRSSIVIRDWQRNKDQCTVFL